MQYLLNVCCYLGLSALLLFLCGIILSLVQTITNQIQDAKIKKELYKAIQKQIKKDYNK